MASIWKYPGSLNVKLSMSGTPSVQPGPSEAGPDRLVSRGIDVSLPTLEAHSNVVGPESQACSTKRVATSSPEVCSTKRVATSPPEVCSTKCVATSASEGDVDRRRQSCHAKLCPSAVNTGLKVIYSLVVNHGMGHIAWLLRHAARLFEATESPIDIIASFIQGVPIIKGLSTIVVEPPADRISDEAFFATINSIKSSLLLPRIANLIAAEQLNQQFYHLGSCCTLEQCASAICYQDTKMNAIYNSNAITHYSRDPGVTLTPLAFLTWNCVTNQKQAISILEHLNLVATVRILMLSTGDTTIPVRLSETFNHLQHCNVGYSTADKHLVEQLRIRVHDSRVSHANTAFLARAYLYIAQCGLVPGVGCSEWMSGLYVRRPFQESVRMGVADLSYDYYESVGLEKPPKHPNCHVAIVTRRDFVLQLVHISDSSRPFAPYQWLPDWCANTWDETTAIIPISVAELSDAAGNLCRLFLSLPYPYKVFFFNMEQVSVTAVGNVVKHTEALNELLQHKAFYVSPAAYVKVDGFRNFLFVVVDAVSVERSVFRIGHGDQIVESFCNYPVAENIHGNGPLAFDGLLHAVRPGLHLWLDDYEQWQNTMIRVISDTERHSSASEISSARRLTAMYTLFYAHPDQVIRKGGLEPDQVLSRGHIETGVAAKNPAYTHLPGNAVFNTTGDWTQAVLSSLNMLTYANFERRWSHYHPIVLGIQKPSGVVAVGLAAGYITRKEPAGRKAGHLYSVYAAAQLFAYASREIAYSCDLIAQEENVSYPVIYQQVSREDFPAGVMAPNIFHQNRQLHAKAFKTRCDNLFTVGIDHPLTKPYCQPFGELTTNKAADLTWTPSHAIYPVVRIAQVAMADTGPIITPEASYFDFAGKESVAKMDTMNGTLPCSLPYIQFVPALEDASDQLRYATAYWTATGTNLLNPLVITAFRRTVCSYNQLAIIMPIVKADFVTAKWIGYGSWGNVPLPVKQSIPIGCCFQQHCVLFNADILDYRVIGPRHLLHRGCKSAYDPVFMPIINPPTIYTYEDQNAKALERFLT